jgi:hypothetical protein
MKEFGQEKGRRLPAAETLMNPSTESIGAFLGDRTA